MRPGTKHCIRGALWVTLLSVGCHLLATSMGALSLPSALRGELTRLGWDVEELDPLRGGYSWTLLSMRGHMIYSSCRSDRPGELYIELERPLPFTSWEVVDVRHSSAASE